MCPRTEQWRWNLNIIRVMQNACVAVAGDSHSQWDKAFGRVQHCGRAVESKEAHETLGMLKTQGILHSKLAQAASRNGESSCSSLGDYLGNNNMRHVLLKLTMITRAVCLYYHLPLIFFSGFLTLFTMKMSYKQMHQSLNAAACRNCKSFVGNLDVTWLAQVDTKSLASKDGKETEDWLSAALATGDNITSQNIAQPHCSNSLQRACNKKRNPGPTHSLTKEHGKAMTLSLM